MVFQLNEHHEWGPFINNVNLLLNVRLNPITLLANQHLLVVRIGIDFATL